MEQAAQRPIKPCDVDAEIRSLTIRDAWRIVGTAWRERHRDGVGETAWNLIANNLVMVQHLLDKYQSLHPKKGGA